jgi:hypothetical protein
LLPTVRLRKVCITEISRYAKRPISIHNPIKSVSGKPVRGPDTSRVRNSPIANGALISKLKNIAVVIFETNCVMCISFSQEIP